MTATNKSIKFFKTNKALLSNHQVSDGSVYFVQDTKELYFDYGTSRTCIEDIIILEHDSERSSILFTPLNKFYYTLDTDKLYLYDNGTWHQITTDLTNYVSKTDIDQTFDSESENAQSGVAIYGALTDGSIDPIFNESITVGSGSLQYDSTDDILSISGSSVVEIEAPVSIGGVVNFVTETDAETGDYNLFVNHVSTGDSIEFSAAGGILVDTSYSGATFTYNGEEVATLNDIPSLTNYVTTNTNQNIIGEKTFVGSKRIKFKQSNSNDKLGFTLYDNNNAEKGYLELNPTNKIDNIPLMVLGNYASSSDDLTHIGFRRYSSITGADGAYNLLMPLISNARTPFNLTTTYTNFYMPLGFTDGTTMITTANTGVVNLSSILPTITDTYSSTSSDGMSGKAVASALAHKTTVIIRDWSQS